MQSRNKRIKTGFTALLLLLCLGQLLPALCGDVNWDGKVDIVDALIIANYSAGFEKPGIDYSAADVSGDSIINIVDALQIAQYSVGLITAFPGCVQPTAVPPAGPCTYEFQAEDATWSDEPGYIIDIVYPPYDPGYVNPPNVSGAWGEWSFDIVSATGAVCDFRYACVDTRPMDLSVNGITIASLYFSASGAWTTWTTESAAVSLISGSNTIRLTATTSSGGPNLDKMDINLENCSMITPEPAQPPAQ